MRYFIVVITFLGFLFSCSSNQSVKTNGGEEANTAQTADAESQGAESSSENASDSSSSPNSESSSGQEKQSKQTNYDSDNDGINDADENLIGTDPLVFDTNAKGIEDGDGIASDIDKDDDNDGLTIGTNPIVADTDQNGVSDGDDNYDADGLTNTQESDANSAHATDVNGDFIIDIISSL